MRERKIEVVEYNPVWVTKFDSEKSVLKQAIGETAIKIEHIGSTSVRGLAAKPIIDILVEVSCLAELDAKSYLLESHGYKVKGENGIEGRRYFQKGGNQRSHQVHVFKRGDFHLVRHRAFRDYLIAHPEVSAEYSQIKKEAAKACKNDIMLYMELKNSFIQHHEQKGLEWYGN